MQSTFNLDKPGQLSAEAIRTALQSIQETHHGVTFTKGHLEEYPLWCDNRRSSSQPGRSFRAYPVFTHSHYI